MAVAALVVGWYTYRYRKVWHAAALLEKHDVIHHAGRFVHSEPEPHPWYDRLPWLNPPPPIVSVMIWPDKDLEAIVPVLADLGTVKRVDIYQLSLRELEMVSRIDSIDTIEDWSGITAEEVRPLLSLRLKDFSVNGADVNIPDDVLELLFSIPTLESVGTAHGDRAVPKRLRDRQPDVSIYVTDFPP